METTLFLAKAWGLLLVIVAFSFLINPEGIKKVMHYMRNEANIFVTGYLTLVIGILSVLAHNVWLGTADTIVTLMGWTALIKGVIRVTFPSMVSSGIKYFEKNYAMLKFFLVLSLLLGVYLLYFGFSWVS